MINPLSRICTAADQAAPEPILPVKISRRLAMYCTMMDKENLSVKFHQTTGLPYSGVRDILVKEMNFYPYKARVSQKLNARYILRTVSTR